MGRIRFASAANATSRNTDGTYDARGEKDRPLGSCRKSLWASKWYVIRTTPSKNYIDGNGRLQSEYKEVNPLYYDLINEFYKLTDIPVIINTSMNVMGEPIVNTPEHAHNMILKTDMDYLVMGNYLVKK